MQKVKLKINYSGNLGDTSRLPTYVEIDEQKYDNLCDKYGWYNFGWYFINMTTIKYYNGSSWGYKSI